MTTGKRSWFNFQHGKDFIEMLLIYIINISEDNYNIVRDGFKTDSVNVMKDLSIYYLGSVYHKTMKIVTKNNNTQNVREPYWFVTKS